MKRKVKFLLLLVLSMALGLVMGMIKGENINFSSFYQSGVVKILILVSLLTSLVAMFYLLGQSRKIYRQQQVEVDEERAYLLYRKAYRSLGYSSVFSNLYQVLVIVSLFLSVRIRESSFSFDLLPLIFMLISFLYYFPLRKALKELRGIDFPLFPWPEDSLRLVQSYDEAEKEVNFEESFLILFRLNQVVIPVVYFVIIIASVLLGQLQWLAIVAVAVIHLYINIMSYRIVKRYYS
ncbi:DUF3169 family protein [Streptococcus oricebi]|uniref:DUF3169 family protein n=1 Tax=Streptococcus oricebi TaxID=1547447 RepID=A0ABS5B204_9STRE|nr:DUF3169 family protein [Streptococcus oricebi]MBP2622854.1 hypothetical protein [Streptococcus oricebi]